MFDITLRFHKELDVLNAQDSYNHLKTLSIKNERESYYHGMKHLKLTFITFMSSPFN